METFEQYDLIHRNQWTELLKTLAPGEYTFSFPTIKAIQSCKAVAYTLNTNEGVRRYAFRVPNKKNRTVITKVNSL